MKELSSGVEKYYKSEIDEIENVIRLMLKDGRTLGHIELETQVQIATQLVLERRGTTTHKALEPVTYNGVYL